MGIVKYLLDTHAFLWWIADDPSLSERARLIISNGENEIYLSAVSIWEMAIKSRLGRLKLEGNLDSFLDRHIRENAFLPLPITLAHATKIQSISSAHRDPFDQMLAAQSMAEKMPLISVDKKIKGLGAEVVW